MSKAKGPLYGLRVVDATDIRGAMCARLLADLGADVLRVPCCDEDSKDSWEHKFRNANKRLLKQGLDIAVESDRKELLEVLARADVFIENLGVKLQKDYGFTDLTQQFPNLVHVSISDFGLTGPRAKWRLEALPAFSSSGAHEVSGFPDLPPCWLSGYVAHDCASVFAALGAVSAIMERRRTDTGQAIEISVQESALSGLNPWSIIYEDYLHQNPYLPAAGGRHADSTYWVLPAKDGWVRTVLGTHAHWSGFMEVIGNPEALQAPEWKFLGFRSQNADVARMVASPELSKHTKADLFEASQKANTMIGPIHTLDEFINHPQTKFREFFAKTGWEGMDDAAMATPPWKLEKSPASLRSRAPIYKDAPNQLANWLDEEDKTFCPTKGLRLTDYKADAKNSKRTQSAKSKPKTQLLEGIRIIEFGAAAVVPEMCWMLTELGAEVIKLESRKYPDVLRISESDDLDARFAFNAECRGRKSVAVDLNTEKGQEIAFELCSSADIVAENYRGGSLDKRGLSYESLSAKNPKLIYVSSQGYGRGGPMGQAAAFGPINSAFAGIHLLWNHSEEVLGDRYPCGTSLNHPDHIAGKMLGIAVLAALDYRARTGEGQLIDMAQAEAGAFLQGHFYMQGGEAVKPNGNKNANIVPHDVYPCDGEDEWVAIVAKSDEEFSKLIEVIDGTTTNENSKNENQNKEWQKSKDRPKHRDAIDAWISKWTKTKAPMDATQELQAAGVSAMMVQDPRDHRSDPHLKNRKYIVKLTHPVAGTEHHTGNPINMSKTQIKTAGPSPCLGADTQDVLTQILGMQADEVQQLIDQKICY